jgi:hypothetical protein
MVELLSLREHDHIFSRVRLLPGGHWDWTGSKNQNGYALRSGRVKPRVVHALLYQAFVGPVPHGMDLDHLCRRRSCVNPKHLEPVTHRENCARGAVNQNVGKTHCIRGHLLSGDNLYVTRSGKRDCRECMRAHKRAWWARHRDRLNEQQRERRARAKESE